MFIDPEELRTMDMAQRMLNDPNFWEKLATLGDADVRIAFILLLADPFNGLEVTEALGNAVDSNGDTVYQANAVQLLKALMVKRTFQLLTTEMSDHTGGEILLIGVCLHLLHIDDRTELLSQRSFSRLWRLLLRRYIAKAKNPVWARILASWYSGGNTRLNFVTTTIPRVLKEKAGDDALAILWWMAEKEGIPNDHINSMIQEWPCLDLEFDEIDLWNLLSNYVGSWHRHWHDNQDSNND